MKVSVSWSGGKDSTMALYRLLNDERYEVVSLHTVFDKDTQRVGMHGVHKSLIEAQAKSLNLPLDVIFLPSSKNHNAYDNVMGNYCRKLKNQGVEAVAYGDIFLEDLKVYREKQLLSVGLKGIFPLWGKNTNELVNNFWKDGFRTVICAGQSSIFAEEQVGQELTQPIVKQLPANVDPCGENGEFHTFVFDGPIFSKSIPIRLGKKMYKEYDAPKSDENQNPIGFWFSDLLLDH